MVMIQKKTKCSTWKKEEREKQKLAQGKGITIRLFLVCTQDTIECVSGLGSIAKLLREEILSKTSIIMCL
jgi:hypothetical protein